MTFRIKGCIAFLSSQNEWSLCRTRKPLKSLKSFRDNLGRIYDSNVIHLMFNPRPNGVCAANISSSVTMDRTSTASTPHACNHATPIASQYHSTDTLTPPRTIKSRSSLPLTPVVMPYCVSASIVTMIEPFDVRFPDAATCVSSPPFPCHRHHDDHRAFIDRLRILTYQTYTMAYFYGPI
jgi:hypothetical protein